MESNDNYFIEKIQLGESTYYSCILNKYSRQVFALVVKIVDNREDAEELTQDIFMKVFRSINSFQGKSSLSTWLYRIAYNTAISATRKKRQSFIAIEDDLLMSIPDDVEIIASSEELLERLNMAIKQLPVEESFLIMLYYMQDKPQKLSDERIRINKRNERITIALITTVSAAMIAIVVFVFRYLGIKIDFEAAPLYAFIGALVLLLLIADYKLRKIFMKKHPDLLY